MIIYTFIFYPKCSTCKKAEKYLKDNCVEYELRDIKLNNPNKKELDSFIKLSGKDIKSFFNTSGLVYKNLNLKDKLANGINKLDKSLNITASDLLKYDPSHKTDFTRIDEKK